MLVRVKTAPAPEPAGAITGKALRDARAERVRHDVEPFDPERREQVIERVGIIATGRRLGQQIVAQQISGRIPRDHPEAIGEAGELTAPVQRIGADAVQQQQRRYVTRPGTI